MIITYKKVKRWRLTFELPKGSTEERVDQFYQCIEEWNTSETGGDWYDLTSDLKATSPTFTLEMDLTKKQVRQLEEHLTSCGF